MVIETVTMVDSSHSSPAAPDASANADRIIEMAALLFAELFYKQSMAEQEQKRRHSRDGDLTADDGKV
jgi:hypothetical protein